MEKIEPGRYYMFDRNNWRDTTAGNPGVVVCRRREDYTQPLPEGAAFARCALCGREIVFDPNGPHQDAPKVCGRCLGITPL